MARALANLLDNARRHGRRRRRAAGAARAAGFVAFDVEDAGPGFPAEGKTAQRAEGSLGLGLVLVRRIADAHRGTLAVGNRAEGRRARHAGGQPPAGRRRAPGVDSSASGAREA